MSVTIGVDIGATKILTVVVDEHNRVLAQRHQWTEADKGPDQAVEKIETAIAQVVEESGLEKSGVDAVGIGCPGPLNVLTGTILTPPNLPGWQNYPIVSVMEQRLQVPVRLDNDANVAGLAEWQAGSGKGTRNMLYLTVSTGIGGAAIVDGRLQHGESGSAAEFGHIIIDRQGPLCGCGNRGCVEAYASGPNIVRHARQRMGDGAGELTTEEVFRRAEAGDRVAREVVDDAIDALAVAITNLIHIYEPRTVVIGGGVAATGDTLFQPLRALVDKRVFSNLRGQVSILPAQLGGQVGAVGAALLPRFT